MDCKHSRKSKDFGTEEWVCVDCKARFPLKLSNLTAKQIVKDYTEKRTRYLSGFHFEDHLKWIVSDLTRAQLKAAKSLFARYYRFYNYMKETSPRWKEVGRDHFADNSIESVQVDKYGNHRRVMVLGPGGDACY